MNEIILPVSLCLFFLLLFNLALVIRDHLRLHKEFPRLMYSKTQNYPALAYHSPDGFVISGIPDEIYEDKESKIFFVEYKSNLRKNLSELYRCQMGAYFLCIEESYGKAPEYGLLKGFTGGRTLKFENSPDIKKEALRQAREIMLIKEDRLKNMRNHDDAKRCSVCAVQNSCAQPVRI